MSSRRDWDAARAFLAAHSVLMRPEGVSASELEDASTAAVKVAVALSDDGLWQFLNARVEQYVEAGVPVPGALAAGIAAELRHRIISPVRRRRGRPKSVLHDEWTLTNARLVSRFYEKCKNLDEACEQAAEFRRGVVSARQMRRDYHYWVRWFKANKSD